MIAIGTTMLGPTVGTTVTITVRDPVVENVCTFVPLDVS